MTTAAAPDDDGSSASAFRPIPERVGELVLAQQDATETDQRQRVIGAQPAGRLERGLGGRVERRVCGLADSLQQREAELELRLAVVGVVGDASGEELDQGLGGWRRRAAATTEWRRGRRDWARARGRRGRTAASGRPSTGDAREQAAVSRTLASNTVRRPDRRTARVRRPRVHGLGTGDPSSRMRW